MKVLKKNLKVIIAFIIGIIACGITVYAANNILARDVIYNNKTVETALNELYTNQTNSSEKGKKYNYGDVSFGKSGEWTNIECGFVPSKICLWWNMEGNTLIYDGTDWWWTSNGSTKVLNNGPENVLTENGFKLLGWDDNMEGSTVTWFAIK